MRLAGGAAVPTSQGSRTSGARHLSGVRPGVTMLVIPWGPKDQDLSNVYSGSADRFRSACYGSHASLARGVSAVCTKKCRSGSPSVLGVGRTPWRYETVSGVHAVSRIGREGIVRAKAVLRSRVFFFSLDTSSGVSTTILPGSSTSRQSSNTSTTASSSSGVERARGREHSTRRTLKPQRSATLFQGLYPLCHRVFSCFSVIGCGSPC